MKQASTRPTTRPSPTTSCCRRPRRSDAGSRPWPCWPWWNDGRRDPVIRLVLGQDGDGKAAESYGKWWFHGIFMGFTYETWVISWDFMFFLRNWLNFIGGSRVFDQQPYINLIDAFKSHWNLILIPYIPIKSHRNPKESSNGFVRK